MPRPVWLDWLDIHQPSQVRATRPWVETFKGTQPPKSIPGDGNPDAISAGMLTKDTVATFKPQW